MSRPSIGARIRSVAMRFPKAYPQHVLRDHFVAACTSYSPYFSQTTKAAQAFRYPMMEDSHPYERKTMDMFQNTQIEKRHFIVPPESAMHSAFESAERDHEYGQLVQHTATQLGVEAGSAALDEAAVSLREIKHVVLATEIEGSPSLNSRLCLELGLGDTSHESITGSGCSAGVAAFSAAGRYLSYHPQAAVLVGAVECFSYLWATQFPTILRARIKQEEALLLGVTSTAKNNDVGSPYADIMDNVLLAAIAGDGAAFSVVVGSAHPLYSSGKYPRMFKSEQQLFKAGAHLVGKRAGFNQKHMFMNTRIPAFVSEHAPSFVRRLLRSGTVTVDESKLQHIVAHPGGPHVLRALIKTGVATSVQLAPSTAAFRDVGNIASATISRVLQLTQYKDGDAGILLAPGPGFSIHGIQFD